MSVEKKIEHLEFVLTQVLNKALPPGPQRIAVQQELDKIAGTVLLANDANRPIQELAKRMRHAIP